jgi:hypothetical protein
MRSRLFQARILAAIFALFISAGAGAVERAIPHVLASHPGNIFFPGEKIAVHGSGLAGESWRALDYERKTVAHGKLKNGVAEIGSLPVGWYEVTGETEPITNGVFVGVIEPLRAPTPTNSPICIDVAMAWMYPKEKMGEVANLCQLAGINRVRDRLLWEVMEPKRGEFFQGTNQYDWSARIQADAGLQILQVGHVSASWANPVVKRFPADLRDSYNFYREIARRWQGQVGAFEPWNEADITEFGGHTGSEMASFQKAAYLGLKAGNPKVTACLNPFAIRRAETLSDFQANEAWPYFDTYNFHHYEVLDHYQALYADQRAVSAGKPMWVSECSVHVNWQGDENLKELGEEDLRLQSERVTKTYTLGIYQGAAAIFYFMLPHYVERRLQYGVLRPDLSPRPAFLAVAAAGRLLAGAKPVGRLELEGKAGQGYVFRAEPDGKPADVMVLWAKQETSVALPEPPQACFDHLGRTRAISGKIVKAGREPLYLILAKGSRPKLVEPPKPAEILAGNPGFLVLQAVQPVEETDLKKSAYVFAKAGTNAVPIFLYNFGSEKMHGRLSVTAPGGWTAALPSEVTIEPGERKALSLNLSNNNRDWDEARLRIEGDFRPANPNSNSQHSEKLRGSRFITGAHAPMEHPVLAMRFVPK